MTDLLQEWWREHERVVVLDAGTGAVRGFLAAWDAWRREGVECGRMHFVAIEPRAITADEVRSLEPGDLAGRLADVWPPMTPNLHRLSFDGGRLQLVLALGDVSAVLPELVCEVNVFRLRSPDATRDDATSSTARPGLHHGLESRQRMRILRAMSRLAATEAMLCIDSGLTDWTDALSGAGFKTLPSSATQTIARYSPSFKPRTTPSRSGAPKHTEQHALVIGAGLAGCSAAWALAEQGWRTTALDRHHAPAQEASGNPAGLFHGIVNPQDGAHARFNRAAALEAQRLVSRAVDEWQVAGAVDGLLRLEDSPYGIEAMRALLSRSDLPDHYVRAVDADEASSLAGIALSSPAWFYPGGGWVHPAQLAAAMLRSSGDKARFCGGIDVHALRHVDGRWRAFDLEGRCVGEAAVVILANAGDALRLLGQAAWPIDPVRGQISMACASALGELPRIPVAGAGYLLPDIDGTAMFGATAHPGDKATDIRDSDHAYNLAQLQRLIGRGLPALKLSGRVGVRWSTDDRLPIIGAVPDLQAAKRASRLDQPRFVPSVPGAFTFTALGSRGITWCALGAQVLASTITGAPSPLEANLLDAVDARRFVSRKARRDTRPTSSLSKPD
ncbi:MAG: FAD-dependent 5-carboxymethylaminomethyl-2-thiouridine(34) oxidoreductase MnmC [Burkholderiales bacterium]|nr:FAD-dependent 5-carboxymethylaminomethyl-2-thiouridine(34) oxidoreductase MnmC [Burkholderiales bacterium]